MEENYPKFTMDELIHPSGDKILKLKVNTKDLLKERVRALKILEFNNIAIDKFIHDDIFEDINSLSYVYRLIFK
jgi:hypothetical protein